MHRTGGLEVVVFDRFQRYVETVRKLMKKCYNSFIFQFVEGFLKSKSNGVANAFTNPCTVNKDTFHRIFLNRLKDVYVQDFRYSTSSKTENYTKLYSDINRYEFQDYLERIKKTLNIETSSLNCVLAKTVSSWKRVDMKACKGKSDFALFVALR